MRRWLQGTTAAAVESLHMSTAAACMAAEGLQRSSIVIDAHTHTLVLFLCCDEL